MIGPADWVTKITSRSENVAYPSKTMEFAEIKQANPHFLCTCGHTAGDHLLCGNNVCLQCYQCKGFEMDETRENVLIAVRGGPEPAS